METETVPGDIVTMEDCQEIIRGIVTNTNDIG